MAEHPILFVGDLHLGRRPTSLAAALEAAGLTPRQLSPVAAWRRVVDHAQATRARAVVLAGDVVDRAKDRFEAYAPLEAGARALTAAGVPVYAVAGNHDSLVLPRLAQQVPGVTLVGAGGRWEVVPLSDAPGAGDTAAPGPPVDLLGWSFPQPHVTEDPTLSPSFREALDGPHRPRRPNAVTLGVVHGDLGATASHYAPLDPGRLSHPAVAAWFLGHIHRPSDLDAPPTDGRPLMGYLGSLVGLDAGEPGWHGAWEVRVDGTVRARRVSLAPARWERLDVPLPPAAADPDAVLDAVRAAVARAAAALAPPPAAPAAPSAPALLAALWRVRLVPAHEVPAVTSNPSAAWAAQRAAVRAAAASLQDDDGNPGPAAYFEAGGVPCVVERLQDDVHPPRAALDLEENARLPTPVGWLARQLLALDALDADAPLPPALAALTQRALAPLQASAWHPDETPSPPPRALLRAAAWRALETLVAQRAPASSSRPAAAPSREGRP